MTRRGILNRLLGDRGERVAARYLKKQGYRILARQSRSRIGELDLVALDGETVVFVEVKTRTTHAAGHPGEAITFQKRKQLTRAALAWLKRRGLLEQRARFDVIAVTWRERESPLVEHFRHAFESTATGQMFG
jgi:putative endonuclease